jgi:hypothetical protein
VSLSRNLHGYMNIFKCQVAGVADVHCERLATVKYRGYILLSSACGGQRKN